MSSYVPVALRREVIERAGQCCEYCLLSQDDIYFALEIEHIISEKHRGETVSENLCLSCPDCNRFKGSDVGSIDIVTQKITRLYNPRTQDWNTHFRLKDFVIEPLTDVGRVTVHILKLNDEKRIEDRKLYALNGTYPCRKDS